MSRLAVMLILIIGLVGGVYLAQHPQVLKSKAYTASPNGSYNIAHSSKILGGNRFGIQIDTTEPDRTKYSLDDFERVNPVPTQKQLEFLNPGWVRFVYRPERGMPALPKNIKALVVFNHESVGREVISERKSVNDFKEYVDNQYLPKLKALLNNTDEIGAIELWNEQDICREDFCPGVYPEAYAYLVVKSAEMIKNVNSDIKVVIGGLTNGQKSYLEEAQNYEKDLYENVDGLAVHPYNTSDDGWCRCNSKQYHPDGTPSEYYCTDNINKLTGEDQCGSILPYSDLEDAVSTRWRGVGGIPDKVKIWITEIGINADSRYNDWQAEYLSRMFKFLASRNDIEAIVWYAWNDSITGGDGQNHWGLYDYRTGQFKAAGYKFTEFTSIQNREGGF